MATDFEENVTQSFYKAIMGIQYGRKIAYKVRIKANL
jgi:hypothetical protein